jgi:tol-pal system protein YbgF
MSAMRWIGSGLALLLVSLGAAAADTSGQPSDANDKCYQALQTRLDDVSKRLSKLEDQSSSQGMLSLLNQLEVLEAEVARLRGAQDELAHQQQLADKRQKEVMADFDQRLKETRELASRVQPAAGTGAVAASASVGAAPQPAVDQEAEAKAYESALNLVKGADYKAAVPALSGFLSQYPNDSLAGNACYWLGFSYYALGDYKNAVTAEQRLLKDYPQHAKVPDAMVSMARAYIQLGDMDEANQTLSQVIAKYPTTQAADLAKKIQSLLK